MVYFQKKSLAAKAKDKLEKKWKIKTIKWEINKDNIIYKTGNKKKNKTYEFQKFKTIRSFGR